MNGAQLQGADLSEAELEGAMLLGTQLQGAILQGSKLRLALFEDTGLWRSQGANCSDAHVISVNFEERVESGSRLPPKKTTPSSSQEIESFIEGVVENLSRETKDETRDKLRNRLLAEIPKEDLVAVEKAWRECVTDSERTPLADYNQKRARLALDLACHAKEVAAGVIRTWLSFFVMASDFSIRLARGLLSLDGKTCSATRDFDEQSKERLSAFLRAAPPAAAPLQPLDK
jgi:hypothetical protein